MKKLIALISAAAVLVMPMAVCAAPSPSAGAVVAASTQATAVETAAAEVSMSVGEYTNNAIVSTPGLSSTDTLPVGQGGKIIVNGVATNMTVTLRKVDAATVKSAKAAATGKIVNLVNAKLPVAKGNTVTVNFYVKGLAGTENVTAFQLVNGEWVPVTVKEIRLDHIVLDLTQSGPVMFVQN
ncbi:MAG: hypothetical protein Q4E29_11915 [Lachnospiraceae bacterium]|nr:hypothetical protein [Lachnospiraceae bacterium]